jgi:protein gp37
MAFEGLAKRVGKEPRWTGKIMLVEKEIAAPLKWKKPERVFVNSVSDLFHPGVPFPYINRIFQTMMDTPHLTYQILTKRPVRMFEYFQWVKSDCIREFGERFPLPNVWLGTSVENQEYADDRIPWLLKTPAAVRFLSCEPLLGPVDLSAYLNKELVAVPTGRTAEVAVVTGYFSGKPATPKGHIETRELQSARFRSQIHWVITGGESGPGARPMHPVWARSLRDQCQKAGVSFFFKQWGEWLPFATTAGYKAGTLMPGNDEIYGGDCGGPSHLTNFDKGRCIAILKDGSEGRVRLLDMPEHRWGKNDLQTMSYVAVGKKTAGRLLDGREWNDMPAVGELVS